ncbi:MAG: CHASE2 domain-containing protein [Verrucomicrobiota bacterium]
MNLRFRLEQSVSKAGVVCLVTLATGLALRFLPLGEWWAKLSYDTLFLWGDPENQFKAIVIRMDNGRPREFDPKEHGWARTPYTRLVSYLATNQCRFLVFDVQFLRDGPSRVENEALAAAIKQLDCVVLAAERVEQHLDRDTFYTNALPIDILLTNATDWGVASIPRDVSDSVVRRQYSEDEVRKTLSRVAANLWKQRETRGPKRGREGNWLHYYGIRGIPSIDYQAVFDQPPDYFDGKAVFIGGEDRDTHRTPYSRWREKDFAGVEIHATAFLNLINGDGFVRLSERAEVSLIFLGALVCAVLMSPMRPLFGGGAGVLFGCVLSEVLLAWMLKSHVWFPWLIIVGAELPCAWLCSAWQYERGRVRSRFAGPPLVPDALPSPDQAPLSTAASSTFPLSSQQPEGDPATAAFEPIVPDYELLRCVGRGAYGEVWIGRDAIGQHRAVKVVFRRDFADAAPYDREFNGIEKYMPVSLDHPGLLRLFHVGRNDKRGYFYYVMELGDDQNPTQTFDAARYVPSDLDKELKRQGQCRIAQCLQWFIPLADALDYLHAQKLIHRDIKPSNIIFVRGTPKLADIGLVTDADGKASLVYTPGYIPPEGPGAPPADIYAFGKVMYEMSTGRDRHAYPSLPDEMPEEDETIRLLSFLNVVHKACEPDRQARYGSMAQLRADLLRLETKFKAAL